MNGSGGSPATQKGPRKPHPATNVSFSPPGMEGDSARPGEVERQSPSAGKKSRRRRGRRGRGKGSKHQVESVVSQAQDIRSEGTKDTLATPVSAPPSTVRGNDGKPRRSRRTGSGAGADTLYGALDLGTNNCRLLIARCAQDGFRVVDAYSRIVRLGEGLAHTGALGDEAMSRAIQALQICADKMKRRGVTRVRTIATAACRTASNGPAFIERVKRETGLTLEIVSTEDEAKLAVAGCAPLLDLNCNSALVFDIGGGSTELVWVHMKTGRDGRGRIEIGDWFSLPCGVVTLADRYGGVHVPSGVYESMVQEVAGWLAPFYERMADVYQGQENFHLLGTSGTVTTIAGVHLGLSRYDRNVVDGVWIAPDDVNEVTRSLLKMDYALRAAHPCVGQERADLVLAGCAIFEAISRAWPAERLRVADRGLREGILMSLMEADHPRRRRRRRKRRKEQGRGEVAQVTGAATQESAKTAMRESEEV